MNFLIKNQHFLRTLNTLTRNFTNKPKTNILEDLKCILDEKQISVSEAVREQHGQDEGPFPGSTPDVVVFPNNTEEVSKILKTCYENNTIIIPFGTGTGLEGGVGAIKGGVCIDLKQMDEIIEVNTEDFDATVQPGVTHRSLNSYLRDTGLWFPVDPGADCSLCGMAATSASGTNAVRYGTMRENVLNLEVVLADGTVIHTAGKGRRSRKSSAGYNLTNLFVGSEGTLGIITSTTLRLYAIPETMVSAVCSFPNVKAAVDTTIQTLQSSIPIARIELLDEVSIRACNLYSKINLKEAPHLFLEFHGSASEVQSQAKAVGEIATENGGSDFKWAENSDERAKLWKARHDLFYATLGLKPHSKAVVTDVCVPISKLPELIVAAKENIQSTGMTGPVLGHVGDGNFHAFLVFESDNPSSYEKTKTISRKLAEHALALGGTCTGEHGIGQGKMEYLEKEMGFNTISLMKTLKTALDPKGLLNPGKVIKM